MSRKKKFDLTALVQQGALKDGDMLAFVSDPKMSCKVTKQPNHEYKVMVGKETLTVHAFAQRCLGQEPPDHAAKWLKAPSGQTLFELWHAEEDMDQAA